MAELVAIAAPADQAEGTEMVVGTWLKNVGESVTQNEPLLEITTDKVTVEIAAPATGILREILKSADQPIQAGEVLGRIEVGAATGGRACMRRSSTARESAPTGEPAAAELTPAVRRLLAEHGLEASAISGTRPRRADHGAGRRGARRLAPDPTRHRRAGRLSQPEGAPHRDAPQHRPAHGPERRGRAARHHGLRSRSLRDRRSP